MATKKQKRQKNLFILKGQISSIRNLAGKMVYDVDLTPNLRNDLYAAWMKLSDVYYNFNKEVGWKEPS